MKKTFDSDFPLGRYGVEEASFAIPSYLNPNYPANSQGRLGLEVDKSQSHQYLKNQIYSNIQISFNIYFIFWGFGVLYKENPAYYPGEIW